MSEIRATTISNAAGTGPATLTGQSAAKAWVKSNYTSGTPIIQNSLNVSSLGDFGLGQQNVNFTNSMSGSDVYAVVGSCDSTATEATARINFSTAGGSHTASSFRARLYNVYSVDQWADTGCHLTVEGDLA